MSNFQPTAVDIANLAARFLPAIELPESWETMEGKAFTDSLTGISSKCFPVDAGDPSRGYLTKWEMVCSEAEKRARTLLQICADPDAPEEIASSRFTQQYFDEEERLELDQHEKIRPWMEKFDSEFGDGAKVSREESLRLILPRAGAESRITYFMYFLQDQRAAHASDLKASGQEVDLSPIKRNFELGRKVGSFGFGSFAVRFEQEYQRKKKTWYMRQSRKSGKRGGRTSQKIRRKEK